MEGLNTAMLVLILGSLITAGSWAIKKLWDLDVKMSGICTSVRQNTEEIKSARDQVKILDYRLGSRIRDVESKVENVEEKVEVIEAKVED